jgi:nitrate reductase delta subunit
MSQNRVTHAVCSVVLSYPDEHLRTMLPSVRLAAGTLPTGFGDLVSYLERTPDGVLAQNYVDTFDLRRRCCLYLTYYTHGDTRRRGQALLRFRDAYRAAGLLETHDELPDHLAIVLEMSAAGHTAQAVELLVDHRGGLELLWRALDGLGSPYAHAVAAVLATLPGPADGRAARRLIESGPPTELVGIE